MDTNTKAKRRNVRELAAELEILTEYDRRRHRAGYDFGGGQRRSELMRRQNELERELSLYHYSVTVSADPSEEELVAAWQRVGAPKLRRVERDLVRYGQTPSLARAAQTWRGLERIYSGQPRLPLGSYLLPPDQRPGVDRG